MTDQTTETAQPEPAAEHTPDWPAIVNRLSAELEEEREAHRAWRRRAEAAGQAPATDRAAVLTSAEQQFLRFALDLAADEMASRGGEFGSDDEAALQKLRRMADETQPAEHAVAVHAIPLPGSNGISACCGRPPCEFVGERVTREPDKVTCPGPAVRQDGAQP